MFSGGISYPWEAARQITSERLASFLDKVIEKEPVDLYFKKYPLLEALNAKKESQSGSAPMVFDVSYGTSPNFRWGDAENPYVTVGASGTNTIKRVSYFMKDILDQLVISKRELRENTEPRMVDRLRHKRSLIINNCLKNQSDALLAAAQSAEKITSLYAAIDSTGAVGGLDQGTVAGWASTENDHVVTNFEDVYATDGLDGYQRMVKTYNDLVANKSDPKIVLLTNTLHRKLEDRYDSDIRYSKTGELSRGATSLLFKEIKCMWDSSALASTILMIDTDSCYMIVDSQANMKFNPMSDRQDEPVVSSLFEHACELVITDRRAQGKITRIV